MKIYRALIIVLLFGLMVFAAGCGGNTQTDNGNDVVANNTNTSDNTANNTADDTDMSDGMEAMTISGDLVLDPALIALDDVSSQIIADYLYDGLVGLDESGAVVPGLALTADEADDGLTYVFSLRTDAVFSDGTPVTADVILANFNRWFDQENALHGDGEYAAWLEYFLGFRGEMDADDNPVSLFDGIEKADDLTVLIHLNEPVEDFLEIIALPFFSILNPAALEAGDYGTSASTVDGTGQYVISAWDDSGLTLSPNADFWGDVAAGDLAFTFE
jgi:ABC-type transport system substrate-binding protein